MPRPWDTEAVSQENVDFVRSGLALWNAALDKTDVEAAEQALERMLATYSPEVRVDFSRTTPDFPPLKGAEALTFMRSWIEGVREIFASGRFEALDLIDTGGLVLVPVHVTAEGASGAATEMKMTYAFRVEHGKITSATSFPTLSDAKHAADMEE